MLEFKSVSFCYENASDGCLRDISLCINTGEVVLLCGESGCGKTTVTRLINGLIPNYYEGKLEGRVLIDGAAVNENALYETARSVGSVFQNPRSQFFNVDTDSELAFASENLKFSEQEIKNRIRQTVSDFQIKDLLGRSLFALSGGQKQKIACASVSVHNPNIIVLDEPSSNLDVFSIKVLCEVIRQWKEQGKTVVIAEHRIYYLRDLVDQAIYLKDGRIAKRLSADELNMLSSQQLGEMGLRPLSFAQLSGEPVKKAPDDEMITIRNLKFAYKKSRQILNIDTLQFPKCGCAGIIGENGAGKTTMGRCLCGLEKNSGAVMTYGGVTYKKHRLLEQFYMVMQDVNHQLFCESVLEEVLLSMKEEDENHALEILDCLDLQQYKELHPMSLSGGQKQRVAIATAAASGKNFLLFDEPTSGLDLRHMEQVAESINTLTDHGKTILLITHDLQFILKCCHWIIHMEKGEIVESYPLDPCGQERLIQFFHHADRMEAVNEE